VVVGTQNPTLTLVPGMTANVRIVTDQRDNVLKVPNAALRFRPAGVTNGKDDPAPVAATPGPGAGQGEAQARRQRLVEELKLDAAQQARVDEIFAELRTRMMELRELPEAERRQRGERARADVRQKIGAILNPEQQKKYAEVVAAETGRGSVGGSGRVYLLKDAKPVEVRVRTGLTDGNATEVAAGELAEGAEVIVGTTALAAASRPSASGPRLPF
jgi:HlyD family secretion protein